MIFVLAGASAATAFGVAALALGLRGWTACGIWVCTAVITLAFGYIRLHRAHLTDDRLSSEVERDHIALRQSHRGNTKIITKTGGKQ